MELTFNTPEEVTEAINILKNIDEDYYSDDISRLITLRESFSEQSKIANTIKWMNDISPINPEQIPDAIEAIKNTIHLMNDVGGYDDYITELNNEIDYLNNKRYWYNQLKEYTGWLHG